jgi:predicted ATPase
MIKRIHVDNYKSLVNFELKLEELTLLVGPNGVGKTSVLDVIYALRLLLSGQAKVNDDRPAFATFPYRTLTRWQTHDLQVIEIDVSLKGDDLRYRLEIEHDRRARRARAVLERLESNGKPLFDCNRGTVTLYRDDHSAGPQFLVDWSESALARVPPGPDNRRLTAFLDYMRKVIVCGIYPASFTAEASTEDPMLARDASNFAAWYRHVLQERQDLMPAYFDSLQGVIDGFHGIRMEKVGLDTRAMIVIVDEPVQRHELRLDELSDGQRALLTLYALIVLAAGQGYTLLLDEPGNYVSLPEIQPWLMRLSDACGAEVPQAVLCSHNPELIDYLGGDCGVMLRRGQTGITLPRPARELAGNSGLKLSEVIARGWDQ